MKNKTYWNILGIFLAAMVFLTACKKEDPIKLDPKMATWEISDITSTSADVSGFVVAEGAGFTEHGICWNTSGDPTITDQTALADAVDAAVFVAHATSLDHLTKYYVAAYVKSADGTVLYGGDTTFTTLAHTATVSVDAVTAITAISATGGGNVTYDGKADVTAKGLCWSMEPNPAIDSTDVTVTDEGEGTGVFTTDITGLIGGITYYVRAYATNEIGTAYSNEVSFTTETGFAVVTTQEATDVADVTAKLHGTALYTGGTDITERGFYWGTSENPTAADNTATSGSGLGEFEADLTGLDVSTTYHARAYAINSEGTAYGDDITFSTYPSELYMTGNGVGQDAEDWNWFEPLQLVPVHSHPELFWKIVWMKGTVGGDRFFKFAPQPSWNGDFGKTGDATDGIYAIGSDNIPVPDIEGYYMVVVDFANNTIEIAEPEVYGMGDVFGNWDMGANPFVVDNANEVIKYVGAPATGNLRMYATASTMNLGGDWWRAEVNIDPGTGEIVFRGNGGDPAAFPVLTGETISLNFKAGTGTSAK